MYAQNVVYVYVKMWKFCLLKCIPLRLYFHFNMVDFNEIKLYFCYLGIGFKWIKWIRLIKYISHICSIHYSFTKTRDAIQKITVNKFQYHPCSSFDSAVFELITCTRVCKFQSFNTVIIASYLYMCTIFAILLNRLRVVFSCQTKKKEETIFFSMSKEF